MAKRYDSPFLETVDEPRMMRGEGAPRSTMFGVLGKTLESSKMKSLGGLVSRKAEGKIAAGTLEDKPRLISTERRITGPPSKTKIPGAHFGMSPYPGKFMSKLGKCL